MSEYNEKQLIAARNEFGKFKMGGKDIFNKLNLSSELSIFNQKMSTSFEELGCVGYNPKRKELTAHVQIKRQNGYAGNLCQKGSIEYVRFYLDYNDGNGWIDQGYTGFNVHDIPSRKDCSGQIDKPLDYVVRLKIKPKTEYCKTAVLPKVKAILTWNIVPAPNDPNLTTPYNYIWGDVMEDNIQIKPKRSFVIGPFLPPKIDFTYGDLVPFQPLNIDLINGLKEIPKVPKLPKVDFQELITLYKKEKVDPERFGHKLLAEMENTHDPEVLANVKSLFKTNKISFDKVFVAYNNLKCNTNFEELHCVGADYNREALVGTFKVKKPFGYSGNLCTKGSREFVTFWIQNPKNCKWKNVGTAHVRAHDISTIPSGGLSYSAILPFNFDNYKRKCNYPQVLKVRAVLSWNSVPNSFNCSGYGNVVESYIQIKPRVKVGKAPKLIAIGGISVENIFDTNGLTKANVKFRHNQNDVFFKSPFGGKIVVEGISHQFYGQSYKVLISNLTTGASYYLNNNFVVEDVNGNNNTIIPINNVYNYQSFNNNPDNILARFSPGSNDLITVTIEHINGLSSYQKIQLDNTFPAISMEINDSGNCTHYDKGAIIKGEFSVNDNYLHNYKIKTDLGVYTKTGGALDQSGTTNGDGKFEIQTGKLLNCGHITLTAVQKTVWDSAYTGTYRNISKIVCLK